MKPKILNDKYRLLSEEQRAILYALQNNDRDSYVTVPILEEETCYSIHGKVGASKITFLDGRTRFLDTRKTLKRVRLNLNTDDLPEICWDEINLSENQVEMKQRFLSFLESVNKQELEK